MRKEYIYNYDKTYEIGESIINIVAPKISKEERAERIEEIKRIILSLYRELKSRRS